MWFNVYNYPKFINFVADTPYVSWTEELEAAGFRTFRTDFSRDRAGWYYWLDDYEYTFFVLRYS